MTVSVVVPFRSFDGGKSRLSDVLAPSARRQLCEAMLGHTLEIASDFAEIVVVSDDPDVDEFIRARGSRARHLLSTARGDLNAALTHASRSARVGTSLIVLPTDLVCLDAQSLHDVAAESTRLCVAPDRRRDGTNLLAIPARAVSEFRFGFGPGSFARHVARAVQMNEQPHIVRSARIAFDLDGPEDLRLAAGNGCPVLATLGAFCASSATTT